MVSDPERQQYEDEIKRLRAMVADQAALIAELRSRLAELESGLDQDSGNSSLPPSRDRTDRRTRRAQERAQIKAAERAGRPARPSGKQPGAPGSTLCRREPDHVVIHPPTICGRCGGDLVEAPVVGRATRQVLEIPEPRLEATDHVALRKRCACGNETCGEFPPQATGPVCWGPGAKARAAYLIARQHLPLERSAEAMKVLFDAPMGEGTLAGLLPQAAGGLEGFTECLTQAVKASPVVHADETSVRIDTGLGWVHTASTGLLTHLALHDKRGVDGMTSIGILNDYKGTIVHDGFGSYHRPELAGASHAQCHAHLVRHLDQVAKDACQAPWASAMKEVLRNAKSASQQAAAAGLGMVPATIADPIRDHYRQVFSQASAGLPPGPPPRRKHTGGWSIAQRQAWNLASRMRKDEEQVLHLLVDTRVPADNNEAERSFRMCKLHDKISGCFRNKAHAQAFLTVRSYLQTGAKQNQNALDLLTRLWTPTGAWLPSVAAPDTS